MSDGSSRDDDAYSTDNEVHASFAAGDPCTFWINRTEKFPHLQKVALAVLSIPATLAPVERIFSHASFILGRNLHNLSDEKLEEELFYKVNVEFIANL